MAGIQALIFNLEVLLPGAEALYRRLKADEELRERLIEEAEKKLRPLRGTTERLGEWRGKKGLAVITTLPLKPAGELIKHCGWRGVFDVFVAAEHLTRQWPDPEVYELAIKRLRREKEQCLAFEGTAEGVKAARAAGAQVCGIGSGFKVWGLRRAGAPATLTDLGKMDDLVEILKD